MDALSEARFAVDRARDLATRGASLWGPVEARFLLAVEENWYFSEPVPGAVEVSGWWRLAPVVGAGVANTSFAWAGVSWAMVSKLPQRQADDLVLLLHELWHASVERRLLGEVDQPDPDSTLEEPEGRAMFRAEVKAWCQAATGSDPALAVSLRRHRRSRTSAREWDRQRRLELTEGLAEYSAWRWSKQPLRSVMDHVMARSIDDSLVRSGCYDIGPAIGYTLDRLAPTWREHVGPHTDLGRLVQGGARPIAEALDSVGFDDILAAEYLRDQRQHADRERRRAAFEGHILWFRDIPIVFDPRHVETTKGGTIYRDAELASATVHVTATDGLLVTSGWTAFGVPCPQRPGPAQTRLVGPGWTAELQVPWEDCSTWA